MNLLPPLGRVALACGMLWAIGVASQAAAGEAFACRFGSPCACDPPCPVYLRRGSIAVTTSVEPAAPSWIFRRSTYTHDPYTGARVAQYAGPPPIEPLDDQRLVTSRYRRSRTNLRGADGSVDTYYEVQQWGNGRGGLDAEWERFHDAWKESFLTGGSFNQSSFGFPGQHAPFGAPGYGSFPGYGFGGPFPGYGFPPGNSFPQFPFPPHGGPQHGGPPHGPPQGGGNHGHDD